MPVGEGFIGIFIEHLVIGTGIHGHPRFLRADHQVGPFRRGGQLRIDRGGERMNKLWPARIVDPERAAAAFAEMALCRAETLFKLYLIDGDILLPLDRQAARVAAEIDGEPAAALRLPADRAITVVERVGMGAGE